MGKPPTRHQLDMALAAISQVSGFPSDGGLDPQGTRAASLTAAAESLELVRKHWTTETRARPAKAQTPEQQDSPAQVPKPGPRT